MSTSGRLNQTHRVTRADFSDLPGVSDAVLGRFCKQPWSVYQADPDTDGQRSAVSAD